MFFVSRDNAIAQLQKIHKDNYVRALAGSGAQWTIPICDNIFGIGKTELANQYIKRCGSGPVQPSTRPDLVGSDFRALLSSAHTLRIVFVKAEMSNPSSFEENLLEILQEALIPLFKSGPACLYKTYKRTRDFWVELIAEAGPVFVALDEIGAAFDIDNKDVIQRRDLFLQFCGVLQQWLLVPGLFFVVLGRASFLNYVCCRSNNVHLLSRCVFKRLSLTFLRPKAINEILKQTYLGDKSLKDFYQLTEEQAEEVSLRLFSQTTGNPRFLLQAFSECATYDELKQYVGNCRIFDYDEFYKYVENFKDEVQILVNVADSQGVLDLSQEIVSQGECISYEIVANKVFIAWEEELEAARLIVSESTRKFLATYFLPLVNLFQMIIKNSVLPLDFPEAFEIILMKRLQEIFAVPLCPKHALPTFFSTPVFGTVENLVLCKAVRPMPQIVVGGTGCRLQDRTAAVNFWPRLLKQMDGFSSLCLKPPPKSKSSDAIFVGNVRMASKDYRYAIGVAAKNFDKKGATFSTISDECDKFNAMFEGSDNHAIPNRINILLFCAARYDPTEQKKFGSNKFFLATDDSRWKYIHEVIVLDLSSVGNRAEFFGLKATDPLSKAVELVISKYPTA